MAKKDEDRQKAPPKGPLPEQVVYMARALEIIDRTETRNGFVPTFHIAEILGLPRGTLTGLLSAMVDRGILQSNQGPLGGYKRLRRVSLDELCRIVTTRYSVDDPRAWGQGLAGFHGKFKALLWGYLV